MNLIYFEFWKVMNGDTLAHYMIRRRNMEIFRILMDNDSPIDNQNVGIFFFVG
jgi:hypothetical protein